MKNYRVTSYGNHSGERACVVVQNAMSAEHAQQIAEARAAFDVRASLVQTLDAPAGARMTWITACLNCPARAQVTSPFCLVCKFAGLRLITAETTTQHAAAL